MMEQQQQQAARAHVLAIPFPAQGHVNPFMQLCKILARNQVMVTFANTDYIHQKLDLGGKQQENGWIGQLVQMVSYPDGLPAEHGRVQQLQELYEALYANVPKHMDSIIAGAEPPISAIICDAVFSFAADLARRHGVPCILFRTCSACGFSAFHHTSLLLRQNYLPLSEEKQERQGMMERGITCVPGLESLRVRDLPSFMLSTQVDNIRWQGRIRGIGSERGASLLLMNTWQELEAAVLNQLQTEMGNNLQILSIGPLLLLLNQGTSVSPSPSPSLSLWTEDTACMKWLHSQKPDSVLYVSFGSIAVMGQRQLEELAWGLAGSGQPFLWVVRPDLGQAGSTLALPAQFVEEIDKNSNNCGMIVEWAPQMQVLQHPSVGGFLSHGGWNSVVESMCAGVPLMCWPFFAEQAANARFVGHVWKVGLHVEDGGEVVERATVAHMVRELMCAEQGLCLRRNAKMVQQSALSSAFGGSSQANMNRLLQFLKAPPAGAS